MEKKISRRELLTITGAAGIGALLPRNPLAAAEPSEAKLPQVPRRTLGKTGQQIPILLLGGAISFDQVFDPKFAEALRFGVNYFDTADCYAGGTSETAIGNFISRANKRKDVWITTKSDRHDPAGIEGVLETSLNKLKVLQVDMLFMHGLNDASKLSPEMGSKSEMLKKQGKIRYFGFSCHDNNVVDLLNKASTLSYIDAIMFRYNFRSYGDAALNKAMDVCHKAGIGLIAMKTQGSAVSNDPKIKNFQEQKYTFPQAVLKAVWADERLSAAVSHMDTLDKLKQNIAAALNQTTLAQAEFEALEQYAQSTKHLYCEGCQHICGAAAPAGVQIGTTLRYLMYHDVYREPEKAKELFAKLPEEARRIANVDFTEAAKRCPNGIDIPTHMQRASKVLV